MPSDRSRLHAFLAVNGPRDLEQIAYSLQWPRVKAQRAIQHALEGGIVVVHRQVAHGHRIYAAGVKLPRDAAPPKKREVTPFHIAPIATRIKREGSGVIAGPTWRAQECRRIMAEHERAKR